MDQYELRPPTPESVAYQEALTLSHGGVCYSINVNSPSNTVAFGCSKNILMYNSSLQYDSHTSLDKDVRSVAHCTERNEVYYLKTSRVVEYMSAKCFAVKQELKRYSSTNNYQKLAVNDKYIVVSNPNGHKLHVYSFASGASLPYLVCNDEKWLCSLKFHPDGDLLTLDIGGWIRKYRISDAEAPVLIWESRATDGTAYALCVEWWTGLVYVTGPNNMLYILSTDSGQVLKKMECEKLPNMDNAGAYCTDIAVYKDTLLTTQNCSNQILVFKLNW